MQEPAKEGSYTFVKKIKGIPNVFVGGSKGVSLCFGLKT